MDVCALVLLEHRLATRIFFINQSIGVFKDPLLVEEGLDFVQRLLVEVADKKGKKGFLYAYAATVN